MHFISGNNQIDAYIESLEKHIQYQYLWPYFVLPNFVKLSIWYAIIKFYSSSTIAFKSKYVYYGLFNMKLSHLYHRIQNHIYFKCYLLLKWQIFIHVFQLLRK